MADSYPSHLEIEIDRHRLTTYLRVKWFLIWLLVLNMVGTAIGVASLGKSFDQEPFSWNAAAPIIARAFAVGSGSTLLLAAMGCFAFSHRTAARFAQELRITVEGSFLRIRQRLFATTSDRKLHFRAIVDYTATLEPLMRLFDIQALQMTTTGGGPTAVITVPGVKDCLQARDLLSEIDRLRENAP